MKTPWGSSVSRDPEPLCNPRTFFSDSELVVQTRIFSEYAIWLGFTDIAHRESQVWLKVPGALALAALLLGIGEMLLNEQHYIEWTDDRTTPILDIITRIRDSSSGPKVALAFIQGVLNANLC